VIGRFGTDNERSWGVPYGFNTKGEMYNHKFEQYLLNSILPLYPHTCDRPGKRLFLKCNSRPGHLQIQLLAKLRYLGLSISVCAEHYCGNARDRSNLWGVQEPIYAQPHVVCDELVLLKKCVTVFQHKHGLLVFGGIGKDTRLELESAFELGFLREWCLDS
jgi:hypothetical protein